LDLEEEEAEEAVGGEEEGCVAEEGRGDLAAEALRLIVFAPIAAW
jgi:hypothetical protein